MADDKRTPLAGDVTHVSVDEPPATNIVVVRNTVPVCIKLCEPICAESNYSIGIEIFDRPVAKITIGGMTRFYNCREKQ